MSLTPINGRHPHFLRTEKHTENRILPRFSNEESDIVGGRKLRKAIEAGRILDTRARETEGVGCCRHERGERRFTSTDVLRKRHGRIVGRGNEETCQEVLHPDRLSGNEVHIRSLPTRADSPRAHRNDVLGIRLSHDRERGEEFCKTRDRTNGRWFPRGKHGTGAEVHNDVRWCLQRGSEAFPNLLRPFSFV